MREAIIKEFIISDSSNKLSMIQFGHEREDIGNHVQLPSSMATGKTVKQWGNRNDLPNYRDKLLCDNNIIGELIDTKRNIAVGNGLQAYTEVFEDGHKTVKLQPIPEEIVKWIEESHFMDLYVDTAFLQWYKHANVFAEFIQDAVGRVVSVKTIDCKYMRIVKKVDGVIPGYVYNPIWKLKFDEDQKSAGKAEFIQAYNDKKKSKGKFILHIKDNVFDDGYYATPAYWGGVEWIRTSNAIPVFHESNLENGFSIRFVIHYPEGYFLNKYEYEQAISNNDANKQAECIDKERNAKQAFIDKINQLLAGPKNGGRAIFVEDVLNMVKGEYVGIKIEPIAFDMKDDALIKLYNATNQANISAQGIHPTLANIESQGKLSSGSEMRNAFLFYILTKTPRPRRMILKAFDLVCKMNGWKEKYPDLKWTFEDFEITKLDDNKSGVQPMINPDNNTPQNEPK